MQADHQSYKRAAGVALLGLALQGVIGFILLIYGLLANDHAGFTAGLATLCGMIVWLSLAMVFDQHRRERIEHMEAETLAAAGARASSAFDEAKDDLRVAAKRLAWMHRALLPAVSLVLAGVLIAIGYWRFVEGRKEFNPDVFTAPTNAGWTIALGVGIGVVGFVFARFVSGMAKQPVWSNLRGGAAQAVGAALLGLALVVGEFVQLAGSDVVQRALVVAFPIAMMVGGAEIVLNFLLNLYRPRKPGEYARPALDSRFLGFIAAPDRIAESISEALNYQFGFDVSSSWFYRLLSRWAITLTLIGLVTIWAMTAMVVVKPNERALRLRMGELVGQPLESGAHFKLPWPFESVMRADATGIRTIGDEAGSLASLPLNEEESGLWVRQTEYQEEFVIVRPTGGTDRDWALVSIEVPLHYSVADLRKWEEFAEPESRASVLRAVAKRQIMSYLTTRSVDDILGRARAEVSAELTQRIGEAFDALGPGGQGAGVEIVFTAIEKVRPPVETAAAFEKVVASRQERVRDVERARAAETERLSQAVGSVELAREVIEAVGELNDLRGSGADEGTIIEKTEAIERLIRSGGGNAAATLHQARADRWALHMAARARAKEFMGQREAAAAAPVIYAAREYLSALNEVLRESRVYIVPGGTDVEVRSNLEEKEELGSTLDQRSLNEEEGAGQ